MSKKAAIYSIGIIGLILATIPLLGADNVPFLKWWIMVLLLGIGYYPLGAALFSSFRDRGFIFSKVLGIALSGFLTWVLVACGAAKFTSGAALGVTAVSIALCWILYLKKAEKKGPDLDLVLGEELIFLAFFLLWTYFAGVPAGSQGYGKIHGLRLHGGHDAQRHPAGPGSLVQRRNYELLLRGAVLRGLPHQTVFYTDPGDLQPYADPGGGVCVCAAFQYGIPHDPGNSRGEPKKVPGWIASLGGLLAGAAVSLAGNMHYVLYGLFGDVFQLSGYEEYWFPDSTRYIGHNPLTEDQCIHEFPSYSFVLGDLHAHVVNVLFVLLLVGILYAWMRRVREKEGAGQAFSLKKLLREPAVLACGGADGDLPLGPITGILSSTPWWSLSVSSLPPCIGTEAGRKRPRRPWGSRRRRCCCWGTLAALPFTVSFQTMVSGVALSIHHTALYQLLILWGLPFALVLILLLAVLIRYFRGLQRAGQIPGVFPPGFSVNAALDCGICGIGLVLIPELVYVRDIYENGYARSNTMFKLTYQAFILFGMAMAYAIARLLLWKGRKLARTLGAVGLALVLLTCGYFSYAVNCWFGNVLDPSGYRGLDATAYLENVYPEDAAAIRWLQENVEGSPVVLEANGDSYSDYCRVSAMTGLPTVLGWYVHEWLWRGDPEDLNEKSAEIQTIYTSVQEEEVKALLEKYEVEYIFVGSCEREKYGEALNEEMLAGLGETVFRSGGGSAGETDGAYIIKVRS